MKEFGRLVWEAAMLQVSRALGGQDPIDYDAWYAKYQLKKKKK